MIPVFPLALGATAIGLGIVGVQTWRIATLQDQHAALCRAAGMEERGSHSKCLDAISALAEDSRRLAQAEAEVAAAQDAGLAISRQVQAALAARRIETRTIEREIINAPSTVACASSPAVGIALDVLRERAADTDPGASSASGDADAVPPSARSAAGGF